MKAILFLVIFSTAVFSQTILEKVSPGFSSDMLIKTTPLFSELEYGGIVDLNATSEIYAHAEMYGGRVISRDGSASISRSNASRIGGTLSYMIVQSDSSSLVYFSASYGNEQRISNASFLNSRTHFVSSSISYVNGFSPALYGFVIAYRRNLTSENIRNILSFTPSIRFIVSPKISFSEAIGFEVAGYKQNPVYNLINAAYGSESRIDFSITNKIVLVTSVYISNMNFSQFGATVKYAL